MKPFLPLAAMLGATVVAVPAFAQSLTPPTQEDRTTQNPPAAGAPPVHVTAPAHARAPRGNRPALTMEQVVEQRIAELHRRLHITTEQSQPWDQFAQVMRDNAKTADQAFQERGARLASMSAVDNLESFARIEQDRAQDVQRLATAFQTLYGTLSESQKQTADRMFRDYGEESQQRRHAAAQGPGVQGPGVQGAAAAPSGANSAPPR